MAHEEEEKRLEIQELRISKNILIDKVEEQDKELQSKEARIADMESEMKQLQDKLDSQEKERRNEEKKERRRQIREAVNRFFDRAEGVLYRLWLGFWIVFIGAVLSLIATIMLNGELRENIFRFFAYVGQYLTGQ